MKPKYKYSWKDKKWDKLYIVNTSLVAGYHDQIAHNLASTPIAISPLDAQKVETIKKARAIYNKTGAIVKPIQFEEFNNSIEVYG